VLEQTPRERRLEWIDATHAELSLRRQCELLQVNRSTLYYKAREVDIDEISLLNEIRDVWERYPFYGYRRITKELQANGNNVNHKRIQRLMRLGRIQALYPGPNTSRRNKLHKVHPYLLRDVAITKPDQAWMVDLTYLRMDSGFVYLVALIDVYSRYVVGWKISTTLETEFCIDALKSALVTGTPEIINSDQGCQFTSDDWIDFLKDNNINISMTGKGRCLDNVYIERFWRNVKREEFYLNEYATIRNLRKTIGEYIEFYNHRRWHQSLDYKTPASIYFNEAPMAVAI
jgi:putative transposase